MNAKIEKTKQSLLDALSRLIRTTDLDEITVTRLCREAGVNRTTFYKYYSVPADVLSEYTEHILRQSAYSLNTPDKTYYDHMLSTCRIVYENRELMTCFIRSNGNLMKMVYTVLVRNFSALGYMSAPVNTFIAGGVGSSVMSWAVRGFPESPEAIAREMTGYVSRLLEAGEGITCEPDSASG